MVSPPPQPHVCGAVTAPALPPSPLRLGVRVCCCGLCMARYLAVRSGLAVALHLVDAKAGWQPADERILRLVTQARARRARAAARSADGVEAASAVARDPARAEESAGERAKASGAVVGAAAEAARGAGGGAGALTPGDFRHVVVLTKVDRLGRSLGSPAVARRVREVAAQVDAAFHRATAGGRDEEETEGWQGAGGESSLGVVARPEVIASSSKARPPLGRDRLWECLWDALAVHE